MHAGKTLRRPGATPLWTAFSRPNQSGVAPGLSPRNGDCVLPACIQKCNQIRIQRRRELELQKGEDRSANLESTTQTTKNHSRTTYGSMTKQERGSQNTLSFLIAHRRTS